MKHLVVSLLVALTSILVPTQVGAAPKPPPPDHVGSSTESVVASRAVGIIATARNPVSPEVVAEIEDIVGRDVVGQTELGSSTVAVRFNKPLASDAVEQMTSRLAALPQISEVTPDLAVVSDAMPNDTYFTRQANLFSPDAAVYSIDAPTMWDATTGRRSVVVAVLDGGIVSHSDLSGQTVPGYDMVSDKRFSGDGNGRDSSPADPGNYSDGTYCTAHKSTWHGTHVSGIVAALRNNAKGVAGIAPGTALQPVRVVGRCVTAMSDVITGIRWASGGHVDGIPDNKTPATIISMSLSSSVDDYTCPTPYQEVVDEARSRGVLVVGSAGNQGLSVLTRTPANCPGVLSVGATAPDGRPTTYTNVGRTIGLMAPGGVDPRVAPGQGIWSTIDSGSKGPSGSTYGQMSGTSMAAPAVSAAAALIFSLGDFTADQVITIIKTAATRPPKLSGYYTCLSDDSAGNERNVCGAGILNLSRIPAPTAPPTISGTTTVGSTLTTTSGSWNGTPTDVSQTWLRDGVVIAEETGPTHTVGVEDLGHVLSVRSTAHSASYPDFSATSPGRSVPKAGATVSLHLSTTKASKRKTVIIASSTVVATQDAPVSGTVSFYAGSKKLVTVTLVDGATGDVALPVFTSTGTYSVQARYSGSDSVSPAKSPTIKVVVS